MHHFSGDLTHFIKISQPLVNPSVLVCISLLPLWVKSKLTRPAGATFGQDRINMSRILSVRPASSPGRIAIPVGCHRFLHGQNSLCISLTNLTTFKRQAVY